MPRPTKATPRNSQSHIPRQQPLAISPEQRQQMIAEAAYYLAEHRGFEAGDPVSDWLQAESEIDHIIH